MSIKDSIKLIIGSFSSPFVGLVIGVYGIFSGYYSINQGVPGGIVSAIVGASVLVIAFVDSVRIYLGKKIDSLKESMQENSIIIPEYNKGSVPETVIVNLQNKVQTK